MTAETVLPVEQAEDVAARTLAAIDAHPWLTDIERAQAVVLRERVASDLAGLREHSPSGDDWRAYYCAGDHPKDSNGDPDAEWPCPDARRYSDGLKRTARLYGVTPAAVTS